MQGYTIYQTSVSVYLSVSVYMYGVGPILVYILQERERLNQELPAILNSVEEPSKWDCYASIGLSW